MILIIINPVDYRRRGEAFGRWLRLCQNMAEYSGWGCLYAKLCYENVFCRVQFSWDVRERQARGWRIRPGGLIYATRFCLVWQTCGALIGEEDQDYQPSLWQGKRGRDSAAIEIMQKYGLKLNTERWISIYGGEWGLRILVDMGPTCSYTGKDKYRTLNGYWWSMNDIAGYCSNDCFRGLVGLEQWLKL